ncbi:LuxR family transcriptional regulator [Rhodococcus sp. RD6.2]|uniref:helix-turn-helix transcriptional regulator n=1 Tax=Rhodococcus sp. RD6.2 TaxID=260936 RepID=UPI00155DB352|nr:LuxR family transcriptional regulator [Rhodococcus sp. RD6.2]
MLEWPLVGRSEELAFIDSALRRRDAARGVVLAGGSGVGKTRLAREAVALERRHGARAWWVTATECARAVPLGAFADLPLEPGDPRETVHRAVDRIVEGNDHVVVVVDDAHLLDDMSALVVNQLVVQRRATVVATVRTGEPAPDAMAVTWKDEHLRRLEIQPLSECETQALVEVALGGPAERATVRRLWRLSRGNVLFLRQLVASSTFRRDGDVWQLAGGVEVPAMLADMVDARLGALPGDVCAVVELLALSEPLPVDLLDSATGRGSVERAEDAGVVAVEPSSGRLDARLAHPLFGEVRRSGMGLLHARRLRGEIATALANRDSRQPSDVSVRRAVLLLDSDLPADPELFVDVGERALALADFRLADRLGRAAVAAGGGFRAQAVVAYAAMWSGQPDIADVQLGALAELAADEDQFVKATLTRATNLAILIGRPDQARDVLGDGVDRVTDPILRNTLRALGAMIDSATDRLDAAHAVAVEVLGARDSADEAVLFASCAQVLWAATTGCGELTGYAARGMAACDAVPEFGNFRVPLITQYVSGLIWAGHLDLAGATAADFCRSVGESPLAGGTYLRGITELARGRLDAARTLLHEARAGMAPMGRASGLAYGISTALTQCTAALGDLDSARETQAFMRRSGTPGSSFDRPLERLADAWVAAAEGSISTAVTLAHEAAVMAGKRGQHMHTVLALHAAARFGDRTVAAELGDLATRVDGPRAAVAAAHAAALAADDAQALAAAAAEFERIGDLLCAADAMAQAADSYLRDGRRVPAYAATTRALRIADDCGGAHSPALSVVASPLPLSTREREIVTLAAEGLTNREIAERLTVSQRTIEGHIYRASTKLGVNSRREFATVLGLDVEGHPTVTISAGRNQRAAR